MNAIELLKSKEDKAKEYLRNNGVADNALDGFYQEVLTDETTSLRLLSIISGDTKIDNSPELCFERQFKLFCDSTVGWSRCLAAISELTKKKGKRSIAESVESEGSSTSSTSGTPTDYAFWMNFTRQGPSFNVNHLLVLRAQLQGNCYLHSAITMEHYLVCLSSKLHDLRMINLGLWEKNKANMNASELRKFLHQESGHSQEALKDMLGLNYTGVRTLVFVEELAKSIYKALLKRPMLLWRMEIHPEFRTEGKVSFSIADRGNEESSNIVHSMVVIGVRRDSGPNDGGYFFLLQNSWKSKFFVECSWAYLLSCNAMLLDVLNGETTSTRVTTFNPEIYMMAEYAESAIDIADDEW